MQKFLPRFLQKSVRVWAEPTREKRRRIEIQNKRSEAITKKGKADEGNQKHEVLLGSEATVVDRSSRLIYTRIKTESKIKYDKNAKRLQSDILSCGLFKQR